MKTLAEDELTELNVWTAEHVMGWRLVNYETGCEAACYADAVNNDGWTWDGEKEAWEWQPTTDSKCAMQVLDKCLLRNKRIELYFQDGLYELKDASLSPGEIRDRSFQIAICRYAKHLFSKNPQPKTT